MENINLFVQHHYFNKVVKLSLTQKKPQKLAQNAINYYYFKIYFWKIPTVMSCSEDKQFIYLFNLSAHASCKILSKGLQGDLEPFPDDVYNFSLLKLTNVKGSCYRQHLVTCNPRKKSQFIITIVQALMLNQTHMCIVAPGEKAFLYVQLPAQSEKRKIKLYI